MDNDDFIVTPKEKSVTITIRVDKAIADKLDSLALQSERSRNELINMALDYALKNVKFMRSTSENKRK
ncbi:CopG family ribbon-helix-helix protein [Cohnella faecalis]|uniref:CopG family transcriptional regulator n=1 Tax=Cohnella faecalis TaxID=2315694 RepID=A0A398CHS0_9BACL|nr:ribbon-helix-helix protein, CopG family [Cohnella faecalis]RIE01552.1 CopG family transcriptional regulator [Cohnella faecalis]